jgi:HrpA-like RNA helicase
VANVRQVDARIGKMMIFGCIFRCLDPVLTIAASMSFRSPFMSPLDKREEADKIKQTFAREKSDHITMLRAYQVLFIASIPLFHMIR